MPTSFIGRIETADAAVTPGAFLTRATTSSKNCTRRWRSRYLVVGRNTCAAITLPGSNPGLTANSFVKLRVIKPAPTSRTSATATSSTINAFSRRRAPRVAVLANESLRLSRSSPRDAWSAGSRPKAMPTAIETTVVNARTRASSWNLIEAGKTCLGQRRQEPQSRRGGKPAKYAAANRQEEAFGEDRPRDLPPSAAERAAHGDLAAPVRQACEEQIGHVGADDQQQEGHCAHQHQQRRPRPGDELLVRRDDARAPSFVAVAVVGGNARRQQTHFFLRLPGRGVGGNAPHDHQRPRPARPPVQILGVEGERRPELSGGRGREFEVRRHDTNDRVRLCVELNRSADDAWFRAEDAPPEGVAQDDDPRRAEQPFFGKKRAAEPRVRLEDGEQLRRSPDAGDADRIAGSANVKSARR